MAHFSDSSEALFAIMEGGVYNGDGLREQTMMIKIYLGLGKFIININI